MSAKYSSAYHYLQSDNEGNIIMKVSLCYPRKLSKKELSFLSEAICVVSSKKEFCMEGSN